MTFAYPIPWWAAAAATLVLALVAWAAYRRVPLSRAPRTTLSMLRFAALAWVALCLMRPVSRASTGDASDAVVPILIDASRSMGIADERGDPRILRARAIVTGSLLPAVQPAFHAEILRFGEQVRPADPAAIVAEDGRTAMADALRDVRERYRGRAIAGVVLLSDGGDNGGVDPASAVEGGPPVFTIAVGSVQPPRDREVSSVTATDSILDGSAVEIDAAAVSHGYGTSPIELRLLENGRPVDVRRVAPAADGAPVTIRFSAAPRRDAPTVYTVEIPHRADELVPENNSRSVLVPPARPPARVLLVQGAPGFEHAFLKRAWSTDAGLDIDSVVRKGKTESGADTYYVQAPRPRADALLGGFPSTREALFAYDAVVLANVEAGQLTTPQMELLRAFVGERGGGLLVLGARGFQRQAMRDTPLEDVLPLDLSDRTDGVVKAMDAPPMNRVALTRAGEEHPLMQLGTTPEDSAKAWSEVPPLAAVTPLGAARPGASVLAVTAGPGGAARALIAVQRYGAGRSMAFTGEASWRWRMMLPAANHTFDRFWRQAVRWLAQDTADPVTLTAPALQGQGTALPIDVDVRDPAFAPQDDAGVDVRLASADGHLASAVAKSVPDRPGHYRAVLDAPAAGVYRLWADARHGATALGSASGYVLVGGADEEMADPRLNRELLQRIAQHSGGAELAPGDMAALLKQLRAHAPAAALALRRDLWNTAWSFAILAGVLSLEWLVRRRWGLR